MAGYSGGTRLFYLIQHVDNSATPISSYTRQGSSRQARADDAARERYVGGPRHPLPPRSSWWTGGRFPGRPNFVGGTSRVRSAAWPRLMSRSPSEAIRFRTSTARNRCQSTPAMRSCCSARSVGCPKFIAEPIGRAPYISGGMPSGLRQTLQLEAHPQPSYGADDKRPRCRRPWKCSGTFGQTSCERPESVVLQVRTY